MILWKMYNYEYLVYLFWVPDKNIVNRLFFVYTVKILSNYACVENNKKKIAEFSFGNYFKRKCNE